MDQVFLDKTYLRSLLKRDRGFLLNLFRGSSQENAKVLNSATEAQLNTLIKILHLILNDEIPLTKDNFLIVKKSKHLAKLKNFFDFYTKHSKCLHET